MIIDLLDSPENWATLGHGYRVEAAATVQHVDDAVLIPVGALFRRQGQWAVFRADDGRARLRMVEVAATTPPSRQGWKLATAWSSIRARTLPTAPLSGGGGLTSRIHHHRGSFWPANASCIPFCAQLSLPGGQWSASTASGAGDRRRPNPLFQAGRRYGPSFQRLYVRHHHKHRQSAPRRSPLPRGMHGPLSCRDNRIPIFPG